MSFSWETLSQLSTEQVLTLALVVVALALSLVTLVVAIGVLRAFSEYVARAEAERSGQPVENGLLVRWKAWYASLTGAVPLAEESRIMLDHNYDGIRELDNHLPPWWTGLFYATIGFSAVYMLMFHVYDSAPLQEEEYAQEITLAEKQLAEYKAQAANGIDESNVKLVKEASELAAGKTIFDNNCKACHGGAGEGGVGPNLTDEYWLHGGTVADVFKTIKYGVTAKGMVAWQAQLKPLEIQQVTGYIFSLQGSNPAGGKAPQGEKVGASPAPAADSTQQAQVLTQVEQAGI